ncbi:MAG: hypothetical protein LBN41_05460 [Enterobacteriaceae bacterium]|jgi:hypothetical protein|nr:hypothetical protein [Enterobacteriaceae bacterium]
MKLSVLQRLPHFYRWYAGEVGSRVEPAAALESCDKTNYEMSRDDYLVGFRLLSYPGAHSWIVLRKIGRYLTGISIESNVIEVDGEPCLLVKSCDEAVTLGRLKNLGIAIADFTPSGQ